MYTALGLLLLTLATARLTRLVTIDKIGEPLRQAVIRRYGADHWLTYLLHCPWCMSVWLSTGGVLATWWTLGLADATGLTAWWGIPALSLAVSHAVGLLRRAED